MINADGSGERRLVDRKADGQPFVGGAVRGTSKDHAWLDRGRVLFWNPEGPMVSVLDLGSGRHVEVDALASLEKRDDGKNATGIDAQVVPLRNEIFYSRREFMNNGIWVLKARAVVDGAERTVVSDVDSLGRPANPWSVSPDGRTVAIWANVPGGTSRLWSDAELRLYSADTGELLRTLARSAGDDGTFRLASWAPDSKHLLYRKLEGGHVLNVAGDVLLQPWPTGEHGRLDLVARGVLRGLCGAYGGDVPIGLVGCHRRCGQEDHVEGRPALNARLRCDGWPEPWLTR